MDFGQLQSLIKYIPKSIIKIAESGICNTQQAQEIFSQGFDAILVGEALSKTSDPALLIQQMRGMYA